MDLASLSANRAERFDFVNDHDASQRRGLNPTVVLKALLVAGCLAYLLPVVVFVGSMLAESITVELVSRDFANYWMGARLVLSGEHLDLFYQPIYFAHLQAEFGEDYGLHAWSYPPHALLLLWPLGFLDYLPALVTWLGLTFAFFLFSVRRFRERYSPGAPVTVSILVVASFSMMAFDAAQNGFLTAGLLLLGFSGYRRRLLVTAICFALLTTKPQLGILLPILMLFDREWRLLVVTTFATLALLALSLLLFGADAWQAYLTETISYQRYVMTNWYGIFLPMMPTVFGAVRTLGQPVAVAWLMQSLASVAAVFAVSWLLVRCRDSLLRIFTVLSGTFLISPYGFNYDMGALAVVAGLASVRFASTHSYPALAIAVVAALPALVLNLGRFGVPIAPVFLAFGLLAVAFLMRDPEYENRLDPAEARG